MTYTDAPSSSKLDLTAAFHQIPMSNEDQVKTAITTPFWLFMYRRMPFGLRNASQSSQRLIDIVLQDLPFAKAYIDDLLISSRSREEHFRHLEAVMKRMRNNGLQLRPDKCHFFKSEIDFIGIRISADGFTPCPEKIDAIGRFEQPLKIRGLKRFLGLCGFHHRFVLEYSAITAPLSDLTRHEKPSDDIQWYPQTVQSFGALKSALKAAVQLSFPQPDAEITLTTDASEKAAGAVLHQIVQVEQQPLAYFSRKFTVLEKCKSAFDREVLAVYLALKKFR